MGEGTPKSAAEGAVEGEAAVVQQQAVELAEQLQATELACRLALLLALLLAVLLGCGARVVDHERASERDRERERERKHRALPLSLHVANSLARSHAGSFRSCARRTNEQSTCKREITKGLDSLCLSLSRMLAELQQTTGLSCTRACNSCNRAAASESSRRRSSRAGI